MGRVYVKIFFPLVSSFYVWTLQCRVKLFSSWLNVTCARVCTALSVESREERQLRAYSKWTLCALYMVPIFLILCYVFRNHFFLRYIIPSFPLVWKDYLMFFCVTASGYCSYFSNLGWFILCLFLSLPISFPYRSLISNNDVKEGQLTVNVLFFNQS